MQRFIHRALLKKLPNDVITVGNAVTLCQLNVFLFIAFYLDFNCDYTLRKRERIFLKRRDAATLDLRNFVTNVPILTRTFHAERYSWSMTVYSRGIGALNGSIGRRTFTLTRQDDWNSCRDCTRTAKRMYHWRSAISIHHTSDRSMRSCHFPYRDHPRRKDSPRRVTRGIGHVDNTALEEIENSVLALHTSRCRTVTNAGESAALLPHVPRLACGMHRCI